MRLHRLVLSNYRGIGHREIEFADRGVTVVSGPNEVGKSSMIEALDLLLESKDRSSKKDVKQIKPTHADVGSEITAEITTGPYRFVYRKRFHKKCETELSILSPKREQLTGDEAHERVRAILAQTVDTGLWQALRVLQSASTSAVDLAGCDALSRALDVVAGDSTDAECAPGLSSTEPLLIEKIDVEYARYYTPTGRETGELAAAATALRDADQDVAHGEQAIAEVEQKVCRHAELTRELAGLTDDRAAADSRLVAAEAVAEAAEALAGELRTARTQAAAAETTHAAAAAAHRERLRLRSDAHDRAVAVVAAQAAAKQAAEAEAIGRAMVEEAERAAADTDTRWQRAHARVDAARRAITGVADAREVQRLTALLGRVDTAQQELAAVTAQLETMTLTDQMFRDVQAAAAAVELIGGQAELVSPTVILTAESDIEVVIGNRTIALSAGQTHHLTAAEAIGIRLPGLLTATVQPGATAADTQEKLAAAQHTLEGALQRAGVDGIDTARRVAVTRRELLAQRDHLNERLAGLLVDDNPQQLRSRLASLSETVTAEHRTGDVEVLQAELDAAAAEFEQAETARSAQHELTTAAVAQLNERITAATVLREKELTADDELTAVQERLRTRREEITDDDLAIADQASADRAVAANNRAVEISVQLAEAGPDTAAAELAAARDGEAALARRCGEITQSLRDLSVQLETIGSEGRAGKLDAARIRREHAGAVFTRVRTRANAARLLRSVMARHREDTRRRYVQPFRDEVERLGRTVFGPTFEIEVDSQLKIRSRTLDGCTVPFESLSGGAKEQLGIIARLAVAALVDAEDSVPVIIDDALGFTDPGRLAKMGTMFDTVGADGQVIVLTCTADRYRGVCGAHTVELTA